MQVFTLTQFTAPLPVVSSKCCKELTGTSIGVRAACEAKRGNGQELREKMGNNWQNLLGAKKQALGVQGPAGKFYLTSKRGRIKG